MWTRFQIVIIPQSCWVPLMFEKSGRHDPLPEKKKITLSLQVHIQFLKDSENSSLLCLSRHLSTHMESNSHGHKGVSSFRSPFSVFHFLLSFYFLHYLVLFIPWGHLVSSRCPLSEAKTEKSGQSNSHP